MAGYKPSKKGQRSLKKIDRKQAVETKALQRMGEAKARGIENPPDLPALRGTEKSLRNSARKTAERDMSMTKRMKKEGILDSSKALRIEKDINDTAAGNEAKWKARSDERKKKAATNYRKGVKAY